jgi:RNA polymerase sigma-32 factor
MSRSTFAPIAAQIAKCHALGPEEDGDVARRALGGDAAARNRLVVSVLPAMLRFALRRHRVTGLPADELFSAAAGAILQAVMKFDPDRGVRFVTFAAGFARAAMARLVHESTGGLSGLHRLERSEHFAFRAAERAGAREPCDDLAAAATAAALGYTVQWVQETRARLASAGLDVSFDAPKATADGEDGATLYDVLPGPASTPEALVLEGEHARATNRQVSKLLRTLTARERRIVGHRVMTDEPMALREIGESLGISRERVRQIETRAFEKLRAAAGLGVG